MDNENKLEALRCVLNEASSDTINAAENIKTHVSLFNEKAIDIINELSNILWATRRPDSLEEYYAELGDDAPIKLWEDANRIKEKYNVIFEKLRNGNDYDMGFLMGMIGGIGEISELFYNADLEHIKQFDYDEDMSYKELKKLQDSLIESNIYNIFNMKLNLDS